MCIALNMIGLGTLGELGFIRELIEGHWGDYRLSQR